MSVDMPFSSCFVLRSGGLLLLCTLSMVHHKAAYPNTFYGKCSAAPPWVTCLRTHHWDRKSTRRDSVFSTTVPALRCIRCSSTISISYIVCRIIILDNHSAWTRMKRLRCKKGLKRLLNQSKRSWNHKLVAQFFFAKSQNFPSRYFEPQKRFVRFFGFCRILKLGYQVIPRRFVGRCLQCFYSMWFDLVAAWASPYTWMFGYVSKTSIEQGFEPMAAWLEELGATQPSGENAGRDIFYHSWVVVYWLTKSAHD